MKYYQEILFVGPNKDDMNAELGGVFNTFRLGTKYAGIPTNKMTLVFCPKLGNCDESKRTPLGMAQIEEVVTGPLDALLDAYAKENHALTTEAGDAEELRKILAHIYGADKVGPFETYSVIRMVRI